MLEGPLPLTIGGAPRRPTKDHQSAPHLLAIEFFATAQHEGQQFESTEKMIQKEEMRKVATGGGGATRTQKSPEVHKTRNEALKERRR